MILYFAIFFSLVFFAFLEFHELRKKDVNVVFIIYVTLFFIMSFIRWETGTDWEPYEGFFRWSGEWSAKTEYEFGFFYLNTFVKQFTDSYTVMLFVQGVLIAVFTALGIKKLSIYPLFSLLILYAILLGNIMFVRQAIATSMLFYSTIYIMQRRIWPFLIMVLLAASIHRSSFIYLLAWPVFNLKWPLYRMTILLLVAVAMSSFIGTFMMSLGNLFGSVIQNKINLYLGEGSDGNTFGAGFSMVEIIVKGLINKVFLFAIGVFIINVINEKEYQYVRGYFNLFWFGSIVYFLAIPVSTGMARFSYSFDIFQIVLVPYLFAVIKNQASRSILYLIICVYLGMRLSVYLINFKDYYVPFKTFINA